MNASAREASFRHQPFYCEENVWHLCQAAELSGRDPMVVFISNASGGAALWCQQAAPAPGGPVVWDYHVIVLARGRTGWEAWDLDSTLGMPVALAAYLDATFGDGFRQGRDRRPVFRVLAASEYVATLSSDRSHMRRADGALSRPAPPWPVIAAGGAASNLMRFVDVTEPFVGVVVELASLRARFGTSGSECAGDPRA